MLLGGGGHQGGGGSGGGRELCVLDGLLSSLAEGGLFGGIRCYCPSPPVVFWRRLYQNEKFSVVEHPRC